MPGKVHTPTTGMFCGSYRQDVALCSSGHTATRPTWAVLRSREHYIMARGVCEDSGSLWSGHDCSCAMSHTHLHFGLCPRHTKYHLLSS